MDLPILVWLRSILDLIMTATPHSTLTVLAYGLTILAYFIMVNYALMRTRARGQGRGATSDLPILVRLPGVMGLTKMTIPSVTPAILTYP